MSILKDFSNLLHFFANLFLSLTHTYITVFFHFVEEFAGNFVWCDLCGQY